MILSPGPLLCVMCSNLFGLDSFCPTVCVCIHLCFLALTANAVEDSEDDHFDGLAAEKSTVTTSVGALNNEEGLEDKR